MNEKMKHLAARAASMLGMGNPIGFRRDGSPIWPIMGGADYDQAVDRSGAQALMPEDVARTIIQNVPKKSAALTMFPRVPMSRKQARLPVLSALPLAYWVNGDTGLKKTSKQTWANKYLVAEPIAVIVPIPEEVIDDSDYDLWSEVRPRIEEAFGRALDLAVFFGTDKPAGWDAQDIMAGCTSSGNVYATGASGVDLAEDINQVMALVENDDFDVTGHVAHRGMKSRFRGLRDDVGQPIFLASLRSDNVGESDTLYSEPITFVSRAGWEPSEASVISGDFSQGILGVRQDITYKVLTEAVISDEDGAIVLNLAQQDSVALRAVARFAWQIANPKQAVSGSGWTPTGNAGDTFPFAALTP